MRECPWCGRMNLNVYAYCQSCGRGFEGPEKKETKGSGRSLKSIIWPFGSKAAG
ncbi:MAG: hypothetical protein IT303_06165 [Dehalococcoidia bacterium]|nr:hypothetical protein [Dehalococcoidia bacterium]